MQRVLLTPAMNQRTIMAMEVKTMRLMVLQHIVGNCYVMAAVFTYLAKDLGYDAHQVGGYQGSYNTPHSWVEIVINGTIYVFDPDFWKKN